MKLPVNQLICGDVLKVLKDFSNESVDMIMTSPPYWGLRDYGIDGQIGLEEHPKQYIEKMVEICKELKRVLKKTGSFYINIGDTYFAKRSQKQRQWEGDQTPEGSRWARNPNVTRGGCQPDGSNWLQPKQLMLMPSRLAVALQEEGWILRSDIIWHKPNPMPSSVKDRLNTTYEHVFHFVKTRKYFYDLDAIREKHKQISFERATRGFSGTDKSSIVSGFKKPFKPYGILDERSLNRFGKNPGDIMKMKSQPYAVQPRLKEFVEYRNLPSLKDLREYLSSWRKLKNYTVEKIEKIMNSQAPHHWFSGESYPSKEDWLKLKEILKFDNTYDKAMTEIFVKSSEKQDHPSGKNPGDVMRWEKEEYLNSTSLRGKAHANKFTIDKQKRRDEGLPDELFYNILGKNPGDFWSITTQPYKDAHFAVFPEKLCESPIKSSCPLQICKKCGFVRERIIKRQFKGDSKREYRRPEGKDGLKPPTHDNYKYNGETIGFTSCNCNAGWKPGIVLDPFVGSGTTCLVAQKLGRNWIGIDLKPEYIEMAKKRIEPYLASKLTEFMEENKKL